MIVWLTLLIVLMATGLLATVAAALWAQDGYENEQGFHPTPNQTKERFTVTAVGNQHSQAA